jgi:hypothetical protein
MIKTNKSEQNKNTKINILKKRKNEEHEQKNMKNEENQGLCSTSKNT